MKRRVSTLDGADLKGRAKRTKGTGRGKGAPSPTPGSRRTVLVIVIVCVAALAAAGFWWQQQQGTGPTGKPDNYISAHAVITTDKDVVFDTEAVHFSGESSRGAIRDYLWNFGDGAEEHGPAVTHSYAVLGRMTVTLTVVGTRGESHTATAFVHVDHSEKQTGTLSAGGRTTYNVPVQDSCMGAKFSFEYQTGQVIAGKPTNELELELYYPNGTKYDDTADQDADPEATQTRELNIPNQEMAASGYRNWRAVVICATGFSVDFTVEMTVLY